MQISLLLHYYVIKITHFMLFQSLIVKFDEEKVYYECSKYLLVNINITHTN